MNRTVNSGKGIVLASGSKIRRQMLESAFVEFRVEVPSLDEEALRDSMSDIGAKPRDIANSIADLKARKVSLRCPEDFVIGCDQVLEVNETAFGKADSVQCLKKMLKMMRGRIHYLHSSVVVHEGGHPVWRHTATAIMTMRNYSDEYLDDYLLARGEDLLDAVGCYKIEDGGAGLLSKVEGDMFVVLGMPLLELLGYLGRRGAVKI